MINRKQSINPALLPDGILDYAEEPSTENADIDWVNKVYVKRALRVFALIRCEMKFKIIMLFFQKLTTLEIIFHIELENTKNKFF